MLVRNFRLGRGPMTHRPASSSLEEAQRNLRQAEDALEEHESRDQYRAFNGMRSSQGGHNTVVWGLAGGLVAGILLSGALENLGPWGAVGGLVGGTFGGIALSVVIERRSQSNYVNHYQDGRQQLSQQVKDCEQQVASIVRRADWQESLDRMVDPPTDAAEIVVEEDLVTVGDQTVFVQH